MFKCLFVAAIKVRYPSITCKRHTYNEKKNLPYKKFIKFTEYRKLLQHNLRITSMDATKILYNQPQIFNIPREHLIMRCNLCWKLDVDITILYKDLEVLHLPGKILENNAMLLKDMGAPKNQPVKLTGSFRAIKLPMYVFKAWVEIPQEDIVANNLLSRVKQPQEGVEPLTIPNNSLRATDYYQHCLRWYVKWKLNIPDENGPEMEKTLISLKHRSFSIMEQLFEIYRHEIGLTIEEMKEFRCLEFGSPRDLRLIIDEVEYFYGTEMKKLIKMHPILCKMEYANVIEVIKLLEKHDYAEISIQRYPEILLFEASDLEFRLKEIDAKPETRILKNNIRSIGLLLHRFNSAQLRLSYLRYLNIKYTTVRLLSSGGDEFQRFLERGRDHTRATEIAQSFKKVLNIEPQHLLPRLQKHPYWNHIDLLSMHDTTKFLLENRFRTSDINENLPIILYSREKIAETLEKLKKNFEVDDDREGQKRWTKKQKLALCLYEIEREFHFSGDGVWRQESLIPRRAKPIESSDNELSDHSDTETAEKEEASQYSGLCK